MTFFDQYILQLSYLERVQKGGKKKKTCDLESKNEFYNFPVWQ